MKKIILISILLILLQACKKHKENRAMLRNNLTYDLCKEGISTSKDSIFYIHYLNDYITKNDSTNFGYLYINDKIDSGKPILDYISLLNERIDSSFMISAFIDDDMIVDDLLVISPMNSTHEDDDGLRVYSKKGLYQKIGLSDSHTDEIIKIRKNQPYDEILVVYKHFELGKDPYQYSIIYQHNQDSLKFIKKDATKNYH
jgi:hypothetical protein